MALRILAAFAACLAIGGCDFVSAARDEAGAEAPSAGVTTASAARPEGWESLDDKGVEYEVRDVDDPRHAQELLRRTGQRAIPVLDVDGRVLTGFNAQRYDALIDRA
jgi:glutaredoxin